MNKKLLLIGLAVGLILSMVSASWGADHLAFTFGMFLESNNEPFLEFGKFIPDGYNVTLKIPGTFFSMESIVFMLVGVLLVWLYLRFINR